LFCSNQLYPTMNKLLSSIMICLGAIACVAQNADSARTALLVIDIQHFYFPGGRSELVNPQAAADNAARLIQHFRAKGWPVIHVKHESATQSDIHETVKPLGSEKVFTKRAVSSFNGTGLHEYLRGLGVKNLVICGMQTHMCVEAAVRAGVDLGYAVTLVHDACTTRDLKWEQEVIPWKMVHLSTLATLKSYCKIQGVDEFINSR